MQRVTRARVEVSGELVGTIERGLCVFVGVAADDSGADADALAEKIVGLRVFEDAAGKMNLALAEVGGRLLAVSQFTLLGDVRRGRRPSFSLAMDPGGAEPLFERFVGRARLLGLEVATGRFRTEMQVSLVNDGPVTLLVDTRRQF